MFNKIRNFRDNHPWWFSLANILIGILIMFLLIVFEYFVLEFKEKTETETENGVINESLHR